MIKDTMNANENVKPNSREMAVLKGNFPSCFNVDGSFDMERFKEFLSDKVTVTGEGYGLKFLGKNYARLLASVDTTTVVVSDEEHNLKPENVESENIYISGDNLDGLKHLLKSYSARIKCIYIDPPYNTGSDGFVYNDNFTFTIEDLSEKLSISEEQAQRILDLTKRGSASHSAWLMFMYSRLLLARDLLTDDGLIFISIDDNEQSNLKLLCDDIFGEDCFLGNFIWKKRQMVDSRTKNGVSKDHDYLMCYGRQDTSRIRGKASDKSKYTNPDNDPRGDWMSADMTGLATASQRPNLHYTIKHPETGVEYSCPKTGWRYERSRMKELIENNEVIFPSEPTGRPRRKKFLKDVSSGFTGFSTVLDLPVYSTQGTREVRELFSNKEVFDFPKPVEYIKLILEQGMKEDDIVLDFFSGSATTAQAIMELNAKDNGNRKYILIQSPERCEKKSEAYQCGFLSINELGCKRISLASGKIKEEYPEATVDLGFKHFTLVEPQQNTLDKIEKFDPNESKLFADKTLLNDFGKPTILTTWLVRDGYGLTANAEEVDFAGYKGCYMGKHLYLIDSELPNKAIEEIVVKYETDGGFNPDNIVLFGYSFTWTEVEALKINLKRLKDTEKNLRINFDIRY
ncbi:site-specific DNA-methyltransferase [Shouchella lonarensis]|uniref:Type III restriction enzyme/adenine-specific DNA-methyltransferase n=1 Tax=Shouchella lonarensis TaxID=1464122 RepID=A0A1G6HLN2_9BACI|nr:site-specific DNA-methyltransferase [Shouchella lonarensis]SDB95073.1 type III restriction enzyme/adenine-specific DNA-methyltransferase [Shouchella lonarensis]